MAWEYERISDPTIDSDMEKLNSQIRRMNSGWDDDDMNDIMALLEKDYTKQPSEMPSFQKEGQKTDAHTTVITKPAPAAKHMPREQWAFEETAPEQLPVKMEKPKKDRFMPAMIGIAAGQVAAIALILILWMVL